MTVAESWNWRSGLETSAVSPHHAAVTKAVMVPAPDTMNPAVLRLSVKLLTRIND